MGAAAGVWVVGGDHVARREVRHPLERGTSGLAEWSQEPGDAVPLRHELAMRVGNAHAEVHDLVDHWALRGPLERDEHLVRDGQEGLTEDIEREPVGHPEDASEMNRLPCSSGTTIWPGRTSVVDASSWTMHGPVIEPPYVNVDRSTTVAVCSPSCTSKSTPRASNERPVPGRATFHCTGATGADTLTRADTISTGTVRLNAYASSDLRSKSRPRLATAASSIGPDESGSSIPCSWPTYRSSANRLTSSVPTASSSSARACFSSSSNSGASTPGSSCPTWVRTASERSSERSIPNAEKLPGAGGITVLDTPSSRARGAAWSGPAPP